MKNLLLTTAMITIGATGAAVAEAHSSANASMESDANAVFASQREQGQVRASDFLGMRVYAAEGSGDMTEAEGMNQEWDNIGEINDVVMSRDGQIESVLVDIGGFLGIGERQVAVNLDQIKFVSDSSTDEAEDFFLVLNANPETLQDAPEYNYDLSDAGAAMDAEAEEMETDIAQAGDAVEQDAEEMGNDIAAAADDVNAEMEEAGDDLAQAADAAGEEIEEGATDMAMAAEETGDAIEAETDEMANEMTGDPMPETSMGDTTMSADADAMAETEVDVASMTAEELDGARVYDSNDEWVGEISELVVAQNGEITDAIVDIGGFLGIGEKPVALKLSDLKIMRDNGGDELRIYTAMAEEELEAMPTFEKE